MKSILKTRRRFLHLTVAGAVLAPFFDELEAVCATEATQKRVAFVFFPHGTPTNSGFWPGEGSIGALTGVMASLAAHKGRMLMIGGLSSGLEKGYGHSGGNTAVLTGRGSSDRDGDYYNPRAASADWIIARKLGQEPLVLGQKVSAGSRLLISWSEPTKAGATAPINDPAEGFKRVFGRDAKAGSCTLTGGLSTPSSGPTTVGSPAIFDAVAGDLKALKAELPSWSRSVLDDQLDAITELQSKAAAAATVTPPPVTAPPAPSGGGTSEGCYVTGTTDFYQRSNYMADLIVAAFQGGARRVATFQQGSASGDNFSVPGYSGYHSEVHDLNSGVTGDLGRVTLMQTELFKDIGYFVDRMAAVKDLAGVPLIDNTLIYLCTEFSPYEAGADPHNTGGGLVVGLIGASDTFDTTGKAITVKGSVGGVLVHAAQYMGLSMGAGLTADNIGMFAPIAGIRKA